MSQIIVDGYSQKERETRIRFKNDFPFFAHNCLKIRPKEGGLIPFRLNKAQLVAHNAIERQLKIFGYVKQLFLKGRQEGISSGTGGRFFWKIIHNKGMKAFILTHRSDATDNLFKMTQRFYQHLPDNLKPYVDRKNAKELSFTLLDSGYKVGTAGSGSVGRSDTIQLFHGSEVAFWENAEDISSGVMQAIPRESEIILESTANGLGNYFHSQWMLAEKGESAFQATFIPWFLMDEYSDPLPEDFILDEEEVEIRDNYKLTNGNMQWRKRKIAELGINLFKQEYPLNSTEAFNASEIEGFIPSRMVELARKNTTASPYGPIIIGVDPARNDGGGDRTSIINRCGRVLYDLESFKTNDTMHIVGCVVQRIKKLNPGAVCIDVIGLGAGVVDRLKELGYGNIIKPINCGETAYNSKRYKNKKAEMWGTFKEWLADVPCKIPDVDSLHTDICSVGYKFTSNSELLIEEKKLTIESKKSLKSRGIDSPDEAEAAILTFGFPMRENISNVKPYSKAHVWTI